MITEAWRSVDLLRQASIERGPFYFQEDSRTSTSFHFLQAGPTSNLRVFGDKSIDVSFIQIAQTIRELLTCFDPPTQRGQTIATMNHPGDPRLLPVVFTGVLVLFAVFNF